MTPRPVARVVGVAAVGAALALVAGCGAPPAPPGPGATADPAPPSPTSAGVTSWAPRSLAVSTPLPPAEALDPATALPGAPPARAGQEGGTQRHTFAPSSLTLYPRDGAPATAAVERTDTTLSGELGLPRDPGHVGWWQSGALAGDLFGSVVLAGHIDSRERGVGFFARLLRIQSGDEVLLAGGGYHQRYRVTSTRDVPKASLATGTDTFSQRVPGRLVLLTCTGPYDPVTHYPDNLVVTAEPLGEPTAGP
jgi:Sortase domain